MKRFSISLLFLSLAIFCRAGTYSPENIPIKGMHENITRVINPDEILTQEYCDSIDSLLLSLDSLEIQCIVAVCEHFEGDDPYEFAIGLGRQLGVGGEKNLGIVVALATEDRSYWISTGEGMEKYLPDAICKRIEDKYMIPFLKQGDWNNALLAATKNIHGYIMQKPEYLEELSTRTYEDDAGNTLGLLFMTGVASLIGFGIYSSRKEHTCPYCGKVKLKLIDRTQQQLSANKYRIKNTYKCNNCKELVYRDIIHYISAGGGVAGGSIGGGSIFGGGSHGGPFGGLGGGSFGGGGAGGRF